MGPPTLDTLEQKEEEVKEHLLEGLDMPTGRGSWCQSPYLGADKWQNLTDSPPLRRSTGRRHVGEAAVHFLEWGYA